MLDDFKTKQSLFYEEIENCVKNKKISHAYLIETNGYSESEQLIFCFIKELFGAFIEDKEERENVFNLLDNNSCYDFISIEPDGAWIKKEQILDVKEKFMTTSLKNNPRIYLIKEADKLNKVSANSLLKFLEEPEGNIIAILVTENRYKVLETIRSRCQIYSLVNTEKKEEITDIELIEKIVDCFEKKGQASIAYLPTILENDYRNKEFWITAFNKMIVLYENAVRKREKLLFQDYGSILDLIIDYNSLQQTINKITVLFETISKLEYNLNITMMLDKFIIEFAGGD